jgi:hypothetical protein
VLEPVCQRKTQVLKALPLNIVQRQQFAFFFFKLEVSPISIRSNGNTEFDRLFMRREKDNQDHPAY